MGQKVVVGPINRGLRQDVTPFNIDNDNFPTLINAYQWRGRIKRKRGTSLLGRLTRFFDSTSTAYSSTSTTVLVGPNANLLTAFNLQAGGNIVPGSVVVLNVTSANTYTDPGLDGILVGTPVGTGTINYATGIITILTGGSGGDTITAQFRYTPDLPVMGLEELTLGVNQYPGTLAFDTTYSYNIKTTFPYDIYDVSFYKNPAPDGVNLPGYVPKGTWTPTTWNGQDYQQFWTVNYQGALWATNGINVPFTVTNIGMQFKPITGVAILAVGPPAIANLTITGHGLVVGDFVFINEVGGITGINFQTGYVTVVVDANTVTVEFPNATLGGAYTSGGIAQYLTNRSDTTKDGLRWYDGDPTDGNVVTPGFLQGRGWVNFAPPLNNITLFPNFSVAELPPAQYYLVGARMIIPFKDRLLFFGPVVQTSGAGSQVYLQDTVIYSQNGTPYYTASFTGDPSLATTVFHPILVPINQTASPAAYWEDVTGFGGFISAGVDQPIITASTNEDVLIVGFDGGLQTRLVYSGNDIVPFNFYIINSELPSSSTFSIINMDEGVLTRGNRGFIITSQTAAKRIDLDIPDEIFQIRLQNNGAERICAQRDYINEWSYFTYPSNERSYKFPTQTLQYNYRDNSWAILFETYTTYGQFRKQSGLIWSNVGTVYASWSAWNTPWNSGFSTLEQPNTIAGNQQGFVIFRDDSVDESVSLSIQNISASTVTSIDHCLNVGDYIVITGALGTIGTLVNGLIFSVATIPTKDTFTLNPSIGSGTYLGGGLIKRMYVPIIQTKQFPIAWDMARKTRLGPQQYLLTKTDGGQITLLIFLSQNSTNPYNDGPIIPLLSPQNSGLIYSTVLYTCPESTNLGLTPANINLQSVTGGQQSEIWHRMNTSLLGDTIQIGFTLSDAQMRDTAFKNQFVEIELHGFILDVSPSMVLA